MNLNKYMKQHSERDEIIPEINSIKLQTDYVKDLAIEKLNELLPPRRLKRGLINPLGSVVKLITGNLDDDDAIKYDALINDATIQQNAISKRITVIAEVLETLVDITNNTQTNFIQIDKAITDIRQRLNETYKQQGLLKIHNVYTLFLHNFQILYTKISELETVIAFGKLGMLHQAVIDTNELLNVLQNIEIQNQKLIFPVSLENLIKLEHSIKPKIYVKGNQLTFILDIPLVDEVIYTYYKVLPLLTTNPLNQTSLILPKFPFLLVKGSKTVSLRAPCKEVDELQFLCEEDNTSPFVKDECIVNLITFGQDTSSCIPIKVNIKNVKLENIQIDRWMVYSKLSTILTQDCKGDITHHTVQGTYVATLDDDCELEVEGMKLKKHQGKARDVQLQPLPIVDLPDVPLTSRTSSPETNLVILDDVELTNLQNLANVLKKSESDVKSESVIVMNRLSVGTVILFVILVITVIAVIGRRYFYVIRSFRPQRHSPENFELREGGVMPSEPTFVHVA